MIVMMEQTRGTNNVGDNPDFMADIRRPKKPTLCRPSMCAHASN